MGIFHRTYANQIIIIKSTSHAQFMLWCHYFNINNWQQGFPYNVLDLMQTFFPKSACGT